MDRRLFLRNTGALIAAPALGTLSLWEGTGASILAALMPLKS